MQLGDLKKIVILILHHNELMSVPEGIRTLKSLQRLSLDHNPLDDKTLAQIRKEGALSVIEKDAATLNKECNPHSSNYEILIFSQISYIFRTISYPSSYL